MDRGSSILNITDDWESVIYMPYIQSRWGPGSRPADCHTQSENATKCLLTSSMLSKIIAVDILTIIVYISSHHLQKVCSANHNYVSMNGSVIVVQLV